MLRNTISSFKKEFLVFRFERPLYSKLYIVCCHYHSPNGLNSEFLNFYEEWYDIITDNNKQAIICGDFNIDWSSHSTYSNRLKKNV